MMFCYWRRRKETSVWRCRGWQKHSEARPKGWNSLQSDPSGCSCHTETQQPGDHRTFVQGALKQMQTWPTDKNAPRLFVQEELQKDLLNVSNAKWEFDKQTGLTLNKASLSDYGSYECNGTLGKTTSKMLFNIVVKGDYNLYLFTHLHLPLT